MSHCDYCLGNECNPCLENEPTKSEPVELNDAQETPDSALK